MKRVILLLLLLVPSFAHAADYTLHPGENRKIPVQIDLQRGTMILFGQKPQAVTGNTQPFFHVEYLEDRMMIAARKVGAVTNVFIDFGGGTIATLELVGVAHGGVDLIRLAPERPPVKQSRWDKVSFPTDLAFLARSWQVHKLKVRKKQDGIHATVRYALELPEQLLLHLEIKNKRDTLFALSDVNVSLARLGGFKGTTVLLSQKIPAAVHMAVSNLDPGQTTSGTIILPRIYLAHDEALLVQISDGGLETLQLEVRL